MTWQYTPYTIPLMAAGTVSFLLALYIYLWHRPHAHGATTGALAMFLTSIWVVGYALELASLQLQTKVFWVKVEYICIAIVPTVLLAFAFQYTGRDKWLNRRTLFSLSIVPVLIALLVLTNEAHGLIWKRVELNTEGSFAVLDRPYGVGFLLYGIYLYGLLLATTLPLFRLVTHSHHLYRRQAKTLLLGITIPTLAGALDLLGVSLLPHLKITPLAFTATSLTVGWSLFHLRLMDIVPVARGAVIEGITDAVLVLDDKNRIVDLNPAFQRLIRRDASEAIGQPITSLWPKWNDQIETLANHEAVSRIIALGDKEREQVYDVRISPLMDMRGRLVSRVIVLRDITEHRRAEEALRQSEEKYRVLAEALKGSEESFRLLFSNNPLPMWVYDLETLRFVEVNEAAVAHYGYSRSEFLKMRITEIRPSHEVDKLLEHVRQGRPVLQRSGLWQHRRKNGSLITVEIASHMLDFAGGKCVLVVADDITERKLLEEQYRQSQKMEAAGQLAGGIAHDFNNLLTVITGYSEIMLANLGQDSPSREPVREIRKSAERATALTRQLLAFSRKQVLAPVELDLNTVVVETEKMLRRLIGEDIDLVTVLDPALRCVKADPGQIEQVIMNLALNARDAMPTGGSLTVETLNLRPDDIDAEAHPGIRPGHYAMLVVSDSGCGIEESIKPRIFEPFFTTKEVGKGTGLGLATVYGIIMQSGGCIEVQSEIGRGTMFKIYLPCISQVARPQGSDPRRFRIPPGTETVLLAEDEAPVRTLARHILESIGYTVLEARDGEEALVIAKQHKGLLHLLLTDVVMPRLSGRQLADQLISLKPDMKVLYMSGYTDDAVVRYGVLDTTIAFLQKPFTPYTLGRKVRMVLDQPNGVRPPPN